MMNTPTLILTNHTPFPPIKHTHLPPPLSSVPPAKYSLGLSASSPPSSSRFRSELKEEMFITAKRGSLSSKMQLLGQSQVSQKCSLEGNVREIGRAHV